MERREAWAGYSGAISSGMDGVSTICFLNYYHKYNDSSISQEICMGHSLGRAHRGVLRRREIRQGRGRLWLPVGQ